MDGQFTTASTPGAPIWCGSPIQIPAGEQAEERKIGTGSNQGVRHSLVIIHHMFLEKCTLLFLCGLKEAVWFHQGFLPATWNWWQTGYACQTKWFSTLELKNDYWQVALHSDPLAVSELPKSLSHLDCLQTANKQAQVGYNIMWLV